MSSGAQNPFDRVTFTAAAKSDLQGIAEHSPEVAKEVLRRLKALDAGNVSPRP